MERHAGSALTIALVSEELPPETGWGGIGTYVHDMSRALVSAGHQVHVLARTWGSPGVVETVPGLHIHRLVVPEPSWRRGTRRVTARMHETRDIVGWNRQVAARIRAIDRQSHVDLVEAPEYHAQALLSSVRLRGIPCVVRLHTPTYLLHELNGAAVGGSPLDTSLATNAERCLTRRAKLVTSPSAALARRVESAWGLTQGSVRVVPNPIHAEMFSGLAQTAVANSLLYVGRIERRKGVHVLVEALPEIRRHVPDATVVLVGHDHPSGPGGMSMTAHLTQRASQLGLPADAVQFTGPKERHDLGMLFARSSVCVVPSLYENFPYTCLEAMAAGRPVVAADTGGIPEIVSDGVTGLLAAPGNHSALAAAVVRILTEPGLANRLSRGARAAVVEQFSPAAIAQRMVAEYRRALQ
jgi:glycogen(starch) synthase